MHMVVDQCEPIDLGPIQACGGAAPWGGTRSQHRAATAASPTTPPQHPVALQSLPPWRRGGACAPQRGQRRGSGRSAACAAAAARRVALTQSHLAAGACWPPRHRAVFPYAAQNP